MYDSPIARINVYIVGMLLGLFVHNMKNIDIKSTNFKDQVLYSKINKMKKILPVIKNSDKKCFNMLCNYCVEYVCIIHSIQLSENWKLE